MTNWEWAKDTGDKYGFQWGNLIVQRTCSDRTGRYFRVMTDRNYYLELRVTPGGKIKAGKVKRCLD